MKLVYRIKNVTILLRMICDSGSKKLTSPVARMAETAKKHALIFIVALAYTVEVKNESVTIA